MLEREAEETRKPIGRWARALPIGYLGLAVATVYGTVGLPPWEDGGYLAEKMYAATSLPAWLLVRRSIPQLIANYWVPPWIRFALAYVLNVSALYALGRWIDGRSRARKEKRATVSLFEQLVAAAAIGLLGSPRLI